MAQDSKIINYSIYILLLAAIFIISYFLIRPQINTVKKLQSELSAYKDLLKQKTETLEEFNKIAIPYKEKKTEVDKINEMIPPEPDMIYSLVQFETLASQNGMVMKNISFGTLEASSEKNIGIFPVSLTLEGSYENFKSFIDNLSKNLFLMDVSTISFASSQTAGMFTFSLKVDTYTEKFPTSTSPTISPTSPTVSPTTTK
jgi:Tfp pilus assembly protein PilO